MVEDSEKRLAGYWQGFEEIGTIEGQKEYFGLVDLAATSERGASVEW